MVSEGALWAIILAGGEGTRLRAITTDGHGDHVPKQYCAFADGVSLLRATLSRARAIVPRERVVVVVAEEHRRFWRSDLADLPRHNVVVQPVARGTAAGVLLPLLEVRDRDRDAVTLVLPSDHFVADEATLGNALAGAAATASAAPDRVALLGMAPDRPETEYGWILPAPRADGARGSVARFVEKPPLAEARRLMDEGALWNTFMLAGTADALVDLYRQRLPGLLLQLEGAFEHGLDPARIREVYREIEARDFSRDILEHVPASLRLVRVPCCGWTDLGTPERVARCLEESGRWRLGLGTSHAETATPARPDLAARALVHVGAAAGEWR